MTTATVARCTGPGPGGVAVLHVVGDVEVALRICTPTPRCAAGAIVLGQVPDVDDVLLARRSEHDLLLMPHGGEAIVHALLRRLEALGIDEIHARTPLPALDDTESAMLAVLPLAPTRLALDLLLDQPRRWRAFDGNWTHADDARSARLDRLLHPPVVAMAGPVNIGKSTLLNALSGRRSAVVADAPGTTRDHIGLMLDLGGLVVEWIDTPGLRDTNDTIEAAAIELALPRLRDADVLIAATDASHDWPALEGAIGRKPDILVALRSDMGTRVDADVHCAALHGEGLDALVTAVRDALVFPEDLASMRPWRLGATA